ncbi:branched-chain-amino-acid aminotransferase [Rodentibacter pneumotropicus]|uniref:Branched-chain-amino-acid aminotransferase n=1 Tax=Rodentibacter pneumotropicus TaxID=758 RepID=A0A448MMN2_9PAST|nr:branched-chain-amino-acid aminotransferase [Rodentibacter pneumotropicus]
MFEGLKAYRCKDGSINLFRPQENAKRMQRTADRLLMPQVPTELFVRACKEVVKANEEWLAPYGSGATLYLRPFLIGVGENIGVKAAPEFIFSVFCCPVGAYFKGGLTPSNFITTEYDRAAPMGTGGVKVGGNYAASLLPHELAAEQGTAERKFADAIYLDPKTHTKIEEVGAANFFGITKDNKFITPISESILPSITNTLCSILRKNVWVWKPLKEMCISISLINLSKPVLVVQRRSFHLLAVFNIKTNSTYSIPKPKWDLLPINFTMSSPVFNSVILKHRKAGL